MRTFRSRPFTFEDFGEVLEVAERLGPQQVLLQDLGTETVRDLLSAAAKASGWEYEPPHSENSEFWGWLYFPDGSNSDDLSDVPVKVRKVETNGITFRYKGVVLTFAPNTRYKPAGAD